MEINLGDEQIIELQSPFTPGEIQEKALNKRVDAFGQLAKFLQRPRPEDIEITTTQKRLEPFWFAAATARYVYDRRHTYKVEVSNEVQSVTLGEKDLPVGPERPRTFSVEVMDHCMEEFHREIMVDACHGQESDLSRYLKFNHAVAPDLPALEAGGVLVVAPDVRGSFVVRKLAGSADEDLSGRCRSPGAHRRGADHPVLPAGVRHGVPVAGTPEDPGAGV